MNYRAELEKVGKVLKSFIPTLETTIVQQSAEHSNVVSIMKELKKINYRLDRLRSDLKLEKEKKIDVSDSSGTDNGCTESGK